VVVEYTLASKILAENESMKTHIKMNRGKTAMKKQISIILAFILVIALISGCGNSSADNETGTGTKALKFAFIVPYAGLPYWTDVQKGLEAADKEFGTKTDYIGPATLNTEEQIRTMESAIVSKVDGIIVPSLDAIAFKPVIDKAVEAGIPVITVDGDSPDSKRSSYIGTSNYDAGIEAGKAMIAATGGNATIGIITGALDSVNVNQRVDGFKEAIKDEPGMKVVAVESSNADLMQATEKAQALLQAYPEINAMFGTTSLDMVGAAKIVEEKKLTGKITLLNFDDLPQTLDYIKKGVIYGTVTQQPFQMGYLSVKNLKDLVEGKAIQDRIDTGVTIVTKENVDTYKNSN
jgi:ribose transport system substrate-binding protein